VLPVAAARGATIRAMERASTAGRGDTVTVPALAILAGSFAALLTTLAARIIMARALTPAELGFILLGVALVSGVGGVASLGLASATGRRVAELLAGGRTAQARASGRSALNLSAASGATAAASLLVTSAAVACVPAAGPLGGILGILAPVTFGLAPGFAMVGVARGFGDFVGRPLVRDAGGGLLRLAAIGVAVMTQGGVRWIAFGFMVGSLAGELGFIAYGVLRGWVRREGEKGWDRALWQGLRPYAVMELLSQLTQWVDMLMLGVLGTPAAVGFYGVARSFSRALEIVHISAGHNFLPSATNALHRGGREEMIRVYVRTRTFIFALLWPFLALCIAAPGAVIGPLFGAPYLPAAPVLRLLAAALLVQAVFGYKDLALIALGSAPPTARTSVYSFGAGLLGMVVLIPPLGGTGAAAAVLVMAVVRGTALAHLLWREAAIRLWVEDLPPRVLWAVAVTGAGWMLALLTNATGTVTIAWVAGAALVGSLSVLVSLYPARR
jgi:O-antigen/teichoic acid export membrane protein